MIEIENSQDFLIPFRFPREMASEEQLQKFHACATTQNCFQLVEANLCFPRWHNQSEALPRSG